MKLKNINKKRLSNLLEMPGISGREYVVSDYIKDIVTSNNFEIEYDNLGSLIATKKSKSNNVKTLLLDAHMDEVGFMVTDITEAGYIKFEEHGYIKPLLLLGQRVKIWNKKISDYTVGVIVYPTTYSTKSPPTTEKMLIDIGANSKKVVTDNFNIKLGASITFAEGTIFNNKSVISKASDDRAGVGLLLEISDYLKNEELPFNLVLAFTVQEEVGIRGARTTAYKVNPDIVISVDTSPSKDFPVSKKEGDIGKGTFIKHKDALYITPERVIEYLIEITKKNKIKSQEYFSEGGTNSYAYSMTKEGTLVIPAGFLVRHIHTGSIIFDLGDYTQTLKLLLTIVYDSENLFNLIK